MDHSALERLVQGSPFIVALLVFISWVLWGALKYKDEQIAERDKRLETLQKETLVVITELKIIIAEQRKEHAEVVGELKDAIAALTMAIDDKSSRRH